MTHPYTISRFIRGGNFSSDDPWKAFVTFLLNRSDAPVRSVGFRVCVSFRQRRVTP